MATKKLKEKQERFFDFLTRCAAGTVVDEATLLSETGWSPSTLKTYKLKNMLDTFLSPVSPGTFRVIRDGASVSKGDISAAFTQVKPGVLVLTKGLRIHGGLGEYVLQKLRGEGAVAHVWEARTTKESQLVAVKVMNPRQDLLDPTSIENVRTRFRREGANGMRMNHPNIVRYLDAGEVEGHPFITMELAHETIAARLERQGPYSVPEAKKVILDCAAGLQYLHEMKCVHRDIKPTNILFLRDSHVLGDLGIVRWSDMNPAFTSAATVTRASIQLGSWYYMAPEQRRAPHEASPKSDVYALGVTWYELLVGRVPDPAEVGAKQYAQPSSDERTNMLIAKMVEFVPASRASVQELVDALANS